MSEFEKKTLQHVFLCAFMLTTFSPHAFFPDMISMIIVSGGFLAFCVLCSIFGLWKISSYMSVIPTERERFLSYKATAKTFAAFFFIFIILHISTIIYLNRTNKEWTVRFIDIAFAHSAIAIVFLTAKSYVLFAFLRGERIRNAKTGKITQRQS